MDFVDIEIKKGIVIIVCIVLSKDREQVSLLLYCRGSFGRNIFFYFDENYGRLLCYFQFEVVDKLKDIIYVIC